MGHIRGMLWRERTPKISIISFIREFLKTDAIVRRRYEMKYKLFAAMKLNETFAVIYENWVKKRT